MTVSPIVSQYGTTNLVTNPVAATNTTGWISMANRTLDRVTSLPEPLIAPLTESVTTGFSSTADTDLVGGHTIQQSDNIILTAEPYILSAYIYIPSSYGGTGLQLWVFAFTDVTGAATGNVNINLRDQWQRATCGPFTPNASDLAGVVLLRQTGGTWGTGQAVYTTGWQVEKGSSASPFVIGTRPTRRTPGFLVPSTMPGPLRIGKD